MLKAVDPSTEAVVVTLGNYIDGGPDSWGVIEQLIALADRCKPDWREQVRRWHRDRAGTRRAKGKP